MKKLIVGIDAGVGGGIAFMEIGQPAAAFNMPENNSDIVEWIRSIVYEYGNNIVVVIEDLPKFVGGPNMAPAARMAVLWDNFAYIKGALAYAQVRTILVRPQAWQKALELGSKETKRSMPFRVFKRDYKTEDEAKSAYAVYKAGVKKENNAASRAWKNKLKQKAAELYPSLVATLKTSDALLLLEYGRRLGQ